MSTRCCAPPRGAPSSWPTWIDASSPSLSLSSSEMALASLSRREFREVPLLLFADLWFDDARDAPSPWPP